jgi:hypothetical protein
VGLHPGPPLPPLSPQGVGEAAKTTGKLRACGAQLYEQEPGEACAPSRPGTYLQGRIKAFYSSATPHVQEPKIDDMTLLTSFLIPFFIMYSHPCQRGYANRLNLQRLYHV